MDKVTLDMKISSVIANDIQAALAYLFGSQVNGNTGHLSDVDLGVSLNPRLYQS